MPFATRRLSLIGPLAVVLSVALGAPASAQTGKIAVIDTEQVLLQSEAGKKVLADLRVLQEKKENEGKGLQKEITDLRTRITEGRLSLAEDKLAELEAQLEEKTISLRRFQDDANRELNKKKDDLLAQVDRQVMPIIAQVGREQGYTLIFRKFESGLIFAAEEIDITNEIIKRLDTGSGSTGS